jgi:hypothetical protein
MHATPTPRPLRRAVSALAVSFAVVVAALAGTGTPVAAETFSSRMSKSSGMYDCVSTSTQCTTKVTDAAAGVRARMVCWRDGRTADNQPRWFYVRLENGRQGFVPASRVSSQTTVKSCTDKNASNEIDGIIAANWALSRNGHATISSTDATTLRNVWGITSTYTYGDWSGDCISFVAMGWYAAGTKLTIRNAYDVYRSYKGAGRVKTSQNPPRGALVFWNAYSGGTNFGHVEISLGNHRSIGTTGWDRQKLPVAAAKISYSSGSYLGWAMP